MKYTSWHIALHWNLATGWQCNIKGWLCISDPPKGAPCIPPCWKSGVPRKRKKPNCCDLLIHSPGDSSDFEPSNILVEACAKSPWYQAPAQHLDFGIYIGWYFVVPICTSVSLMFCAELGGRKQIGFSLLGMAWTRTTRSCYVWGNGSTQPSAWKITPGISSSAESEETGTYNKRKGLIFFWLIMVYIYILLYIIHMNWHLTELLKRRNLLRTPAFTDWLWFIDHFQPHSQQCLVWRCLASGEFWGFLFSATMISLALWTGRSLSTWCETPCLCHKKL